jgi:hypothetical protein
MSTPLKELRLGISETIDVALEAESRAFGRERQAIAREVLSGWARRKIHEHKVMARLLMASGLQPELDGFVTEDAGSGRSQPAGGRR